MNPVQPMPTPPTPFTVASGPMSPLVSAREVPDGIEIRVREAAVTLPTTMAMRLAHTLLSLSLGDRHAS